MKEPVKAFATIIVRGDLKYCSKECSKEKERGYAIEKVTGKRQWPFFWKIRYKVKMRKHYLIGENGVICQVPSTIDVKDFCL